MFFKKSIISERKSNNSKPRIALLRGTVLEKRNTREMELLTDYFDVVAFGKPIRKNDKDTISLPIKELYTKKIVYPISEQTVFEPFKTHMIGLEEELKDFDIAFTGDSFFQMSYQAIEAKKKYGVKVVVLQNENIPLNFNRDGTNYIHNTVMRNADYFIAIANSAKDALMIEGIPENKITVIPWGIDCSRFENIAVETKIDFLKKYGIPQDSIKILYVGRLDWSKGVFDIIYAAKKILSDRELENKNIVFLFVGNGPEKNTLNKQLTILGIENKFYFCGSVPLEEIEIPYLIADILLVPSIPTVTWKEQFGQVLVEGMAAGLPIITTNTGAIPEVVGDTAILIPPADYITLAKELKKLILIPELRKKLGDKAKIRVKEKYDIKIVSLMLKDVFNRLLYLNK